MRAVDVVEFTDPACPFAYSAEPVRQRLLWRFGAQLTWTVRVVGLARDRAAQEAKGFDEVRNAEVLRDFDAYGMPLAVVDRRTPAGSWDACRRIVAAREHGTGKESALLRELRIAGIAHARPIDDPDVLASAARAAGLDPAELDAWVADEDDDRAFRDDLVAARHPGPAALALDHKLADVEADWPATVGGDASLAGPGRRYTCPTYVLHAGDRVAEVPGFQPWAAIEAVLANLAPDLDRRAWADDPLEALRWAGSPLATVEVAAIMGLDDRDEARERLRDAGAVERRAGNDALWTAA
ncbi:MAG: DsbA family protein [Solirubrobacteraceae bacterium]|nr:DsbA family protein [Solirubrobacteraceae bacterium]